jgi:hypothetical protein
MTGLPWKQPGSISVKPTAVVQRGLLAHELFHLIQFRMQEVRGSGFMSEATARWAENSFLGVSQAVWANPQAGLDCLGPTCGSTRTEQGGYDRWTFFAFLSNRYGMRIVREIYEQPVDGPVEAIDRALAAHGSTLSREFTAFVSADVRSPHDELTTTASVQTVDLGLRRSRRATSG